MKVVLFCGGLGMRLREHSETLPKPMIPIGNRPILWHVVKYYARYGHRDFILCLGYKAASIKDYFLRYDEALSNDFVLSEGGKNLQLLGKEERAQDNPGVDPAEKLADGRIPYETSILVRKGFCRLFSVFSCWEP